MAATVNCKSIISQTGKIEYAPSSWLRSDFHRWIACFMPNKPKKLRLANNIDRVRLHIEKLSTALSGIRGKQEKKNFKINPSGFGILQKLISKWSS
ncbi:hypothetical protein L484_008827 [Morus notabilis]|uniref:Uncharacterized protein n=1 Tax=Morus notabilis TaxID=981085 RepID=W9R5H8_9ROSA|nr:hypothetical protein L484_008827 [Morus notabilis]